MAARGCGSSRTQGGCYIECPLSPFGKPIDYFLVDPPIPVDAQEMGVTPIGVKLIERDGVWHVIDWVGSVHYPNPADYVEEVKVLGLSRRVPTTLDFKKLTMHSRILLLHSHAYIENHHLYYQHEPENIVTPYPVCPKHLIQHRRPAMETMCARLWYQDVSGGENEEGRSVVRKMPSFEYKALSKPKSVEPKYKLAIFASFPITNLAVIKDTQGGTHERSMMLAQEAKIPVKLCEE